MSKLKKVILVMILTIVAVISFNYKSYANQITDYSEELHNYLFSDDFKADHLWNWDHQPTLMFEDDNISLWCVEEGIGISEYMTADVALYYAYKGEGFSSSSFDATVEWITGTSSTYSSNNSVTYMSTDSTLYKYYRISASEGFIPDHSTDNIRYGINYTQSFKYYLTYIFNVLYNSMHDDYTNSLNTFKSYYGYSLRSASIVPGGDNEESDYEGDDQDILGAITKNLPGKSNGTNVTFAHESVYAIEYYIKETYDAEEIQDKLFVYTTLRSDITGASEVPLYDETGTLTTDEREEGRFSNYEIQYAIWYLLDQAADKTNLGLIADRYYNNFYKVLKEQVNDSDNDGHTYDDNIQVLTEDEDGNEENVERETQTLTLGGTTDDYDVYTYDNTIVEVDTSNDCYILGPFKIDYTVDDDYNDTYEIGGGYTDSDGEAITIKLSAVQEVTIYNQDGTNIEDLGGSFKLAYGYNGTCLDLDGSALRDGVKLEKINNTTWATFDLEDYQGTSDTALDGAETDAIASDEEFYIVIYRGSMKAEEFTGFYAKFDFAYLDRIEGTVSHYDTNVYEYYYIPYTSGDYTYTYQRTC